MWEFVWALLVCFLVVFVFAFMIMVVVETIRMSVLWLTGAKDFAELGKRFDKWTAEARERRVARGGPATLRGVLVVLAWRIWKAYVHPIRTWRGEFVYPPKKGTPPDSRS